MGDDNEIRDLIHREAEDFVKKAKDASSKLVATYNFEEEFAKTRKNRSLLVPLVTLGTILVLGVVSFGVSVWIEQRNEAAPVDVRSFEDLNLKDLLDSAKRNETDMRKAIADQTQLEFELRSALDAADRDYKSELDSIKVKANSKAEETTQSAAAKKAWELKRTQITASFATRVAAKKAEIKAIQDKIDKYDQRLMKQANEQKAILDNAQRIFDNEKQTLTTQYEKRIKDIQAQRKTDIAALTKQRDELVASLTARYNPTFADARTAALLAGWKAPPSYGPYASLSDYLVTNGFVKKEEVSSLDASLANLGYLTGKLRGVPWINSVPPAMSRVEAESLVSIGGYRAIIGRTTTGLEQRDRNIADRDGKITDLNNKVASVETERDRLNWAISRYALIQRETGFIVDPRDPSSIILAINPTIPVSDGALAYVVRGEKTIATIQLLVRGGNATAVPVEIAEGESILPFDSVLVRTDAESSK
ncbi:MAG: hypothetical protein WCL50_04785 [Spirochaetota bacterium]